MPTSGWTDRPDRDPISVAGNLILDGRDLAVTLVNVSNDGCLVACDETLPIGVAVSLRVGAVTIGATIRWSTFGKAGLRFVK